MRIAINGFGRIGRLVFRNLVNRSDLEVVAINDLAAPETNMHLFQYDSVHGTLKEKASLENAHLTVGKQRAKLLSERSVENLPWADLNVDIVVESTGIFTKRADAQKHLNAGAKRVVISAPATDPDATFCIGINHTEFRPSEHRIVSNASCTTNCLAPVALVLDKEFGIESGLMTTIHSYTNDQRILDQDHKDLRRARAGALNMIPTSTGAAKAIGLVLPHLKGKLDGFAVRVPTPNVSLVDLSVKLKNETSLEVLLGKMKEYSETSLKGILGFNELPLVSSDFNSNSYSSVVDASFCRMTDGKFAKVLAWYDNEYGYSNRVVDLCAYIAANL